MTIFVAMLRGINVGGQKRMHMQTLRGIYEQLGFGNVRTYLQSGNVVFESPPADPAFLVRRIEPHIEETCGYHVAVFIRKPDELQRILAGTPFLNPKNEDPGKLHVTFLYQPPSVPGLSSLPTPKGTRDELAPGEMANC